MWKWIGQSEISKFNNILELTKGKPDEDILGLPCTKTGYIKAKRLEQRCIVTVDICDVQY